MLPREVFHVWTVHSCINGNEYLAFEWLLIIQYRLASPKKNGNIPGDTLQKNSSANMALSAGLARVRKRIRLLGNIVKCTWTNVGFEKRWFISNVAFTTNTHILLFFASNFKRTSSAPDVKSLLAPLTDTDPRSLETDLASLLVKQKTKSMSGKLQKKDFYVINMIDMNMMLIRSLSSNGGKIWWWGCWIGMFKCIVLNRWTPSRHSRKRCFPSIIRIWIRVFS